MISIEEEADGDSLPVTVSYLTLVPTTRRIFFFPEVPDIAVHSVDELWIVPAPEKSRRGEGLVFTKLNEWSRIINGQY